MTARILVVDDVPANVKLLETKLAAEYFDVLTASDGLSALEVAEDQLPDIILLDIMMPGMDGFEVCQRLKDSTKTRHIPVVMVTALSEVPDRVRGLESGADDFLSKPVNDIALFARVRSLLRLKMMTDELRLRQETSGDLGVFESDLEDDDDPQDARVLIVENNEMMADRLARYLGESGCVTDHAATTTEGQVLGRDGNYDLVIVNLQVGGEDGLRFCSHYRSNEQTRHVPILLLLDDLDLPQLAKGLDIGVTDYLIKPVDRGELLARVRTQIRRHRYHHRLRLNLQQSVNMAFTDPLTGVYNRRYMSAHLDRKIMEIATAEKPVSVILFDIDHFKAINDTHGHGAGDQVLKQLAARVSNNLRSFDLVARYGGEEFVVIMPDTNAEIALRVADRLRNHVAREAFKVEGLDTPLEVTVSMGVTTAMEPDETADIILERADRALYQARSDGRNRAISAELGGPNETTGPLVSTG